MRGDGVGVGDVGAVPDILWGEGDAAGGDDGGGALRERQRHSLGGCGRHERDRTIQRCGDGVSVGDSTRGWSGACVVHSVGTDGGDRMRGDGVGVGDVGAVFAFGYYCVCSHGVFFVVSGCWKFLTVVFTGCFIGLRSY